MECVGGIWNTGRFSYIELEEKLIEARRFTREKIGLSKEWFVFVLKGNRIIFQFMVPSQAHLDEEITDFYEKWPACERPLLSYVIQCEYGCVIDDPVDEGEKSVDLRDI